MWPCIVYAKMRWANSYLINLRGGVNIQVMSEQNCIKQDLPVIYILICSMKYPIWQRYLYRISHNKSINRVIGYGLLICITDRWKYFLIIITYRQDPSDSWIMVKMEVFSTQVKQLQHEAEHSSPNNTKVNASSFATAQSPTCFGHRALGQGQLCTFNTSTFKYRC